MSTNHAGSAESPVPPPQQCAGTGTLPDAATQPPAPFRPEFSIVELHYRHDGWTPERQRDFIEALADTLAPALAAARVGMSEQCAYQLRRRRRVDRENRL